MIPQASFTRVRLLKTLLWVAATAVLAIGGTLGYISVFGTPGVAQQADSGQGGAAAGGGRPGASPGGAGGPGGAAGGGRPPSLVVTGDVGERLINDRLKAVGSGTAVTSVSVVPLSGGIVKEVLVKAGQKVEANAVLARLDDVEEKIARDRAAANLAEAESDRRRLSELLRSNTATQVEVDQVSAAAADARLVLQESEVQLERRTITAPIAGIVGFVSVDPGNYITAQTELMTIDDRSQLVVDFWVPERFANQVTLDQSVSAVAISSPGTPYTGTINGIGSRIEPASRTLPVKAVIDNVNDTLRPGMSFEMLLNFPGEKYPTVDPLAVQWDTNGSFVWKLTAENKVERVPALIIQRNANSVLLDAAIQPGDRVIDEGLMTLRDGAEVRVSNPKPKPAGEGNGNGLAKSSGNSGNNAEGEVKTGAAETKAAATNGSQGS